VGRARGALGASSSGEAGAGTSLSTWARPNLTAAQQKTKPCLAKHAGEPDRLARVLGAVVWVYPGAGGPERQGSRRPGGSANESAPTGTGASSTVELDLPAVSRPYGRLVGDHAFFAFLRRLPAFLALRFAGARFFATLGAFFAAGLRADFVRVFFAAIFFDASLMGDEPGSPRGYVARRILPPNVLCQRKMCKRLRTGAL
jgi:hypothetical protein